MSTNNFHPDDRNVWLYHDYSGWSGKNGDVVLDHILLRSGKYKNSIFNSIPLLNFEENINMHGELHTFENQKTMLQYTAKWIFQEIANGSYQLKERDKLFLHTNRDYYL